MPLLVTRSTRALDTTGPTAPTITAGATGPSTALISRTVLATDISGILNYETQRSLAGAGAWSSFDLSNTNPLTAAGLSGGTAYDFRQRAYDTFGNAGTFSATVSATTTSELSLYYAGPDIGYLTPTIYAAPAALGNGSGSSEANATTLTNALATATAGAIIGVLPGVYSTGGGGSGISPAWQPTNTGTAANPIYIVAKYSAVDLIGKTRGSTWSTADTASVMAHANRSELRHTGVTSDGEGTGGPAFGIIDSNYCHWIGVCADEATAQPHSNTGLAIIWSTTGSSISRCVLMARNPGYVTNPSDNHPNIRFENAVNCAARDNVLHGSFAGPASNHNNIQRYESRGTVVEYNFCAGLHTGIFLKDQDTSRSEIVRYNYTTNPTYGMHIRNVNIGVSDLCDVYQNLLTGSAEPVVFQIEGYNIQFHHNTVVGPMSGFGASQGFLGYYQGTGCYLRNNIIVGTTGSAFIDQQYRTSNITPTDYNRYWRTGTQFGARFNNVTYSSLGAWQGSPNFQDIHSSLGDPQFANAAAGDYRPLAAAVLTMSDTAGPVGCDGINQGPRYA